MARRKAAPRGRIARSGRTAARSANVAEKSQKKGPEMSLPESDQAATPAKRSPRKAAPRGKWSEEHLLTSDKSALLDVDLKELLCKPEAWKCLEEDEKREILALLPADTHPDVDLTSDDPNAKIPPLPLSFVKYSVNWQDGLRQFQLDLENGRYDPEWLRQAESARRQRENGDFDSFKEREFEQFWGQKQKMDMRLPAGECGRIKLGTLVEDGVFLPGDVWRFTYVFGKGADRMVIDKEARVHEINGSKLTFLIPTGQRVFLTSVPNKDLESKAPDQAAENKEEDIEMKAAEVNSAEASTKVEPDEVTTMAEGNSASPPEATTAMDEKISDATAPAEETTAPAEETTAPAEEIAAPAEGSESKGNNEIAPVELATAPNEQRQGNGPSVQVVIVSPRSSSSSTQEALKRAIPQPATEPPAKRKRGRPRKVRPIEPEPEAEAEAEPEPKPEVEAEPESEIPSQPAAETQEPEKNSDPTSPVDTPMEFTNPPPAPESSNINENTMVSAPTPKEPDQIEPPTSPLSELPADLTPPSSQPVTSVPDEITVPNISTPQMLVKRILQIDGRPKEGARTANAWKEIRCYRKNQDIGSLWDVRQVWYLKKK